ncbi:hypothetical protein [Metabacillus sp. Hm71]|uniref:hypothetical protein n=1 Tax=Metabacillus sp. Hm71 TaxID=3450743 RepID=UPI003F443CCD
MIRKGDYAVVQGKEYRLGKHGDEWVNIISDDQNDLNNGFQPHPLDKTVLLKRVLKNELEQVYYVDTYAVYKDTKLSVGNVKDDKVLLGTSDSKIAKQLDFDRTDKYFYEKWVNISELELFEEKKSITI